MLTEAIEYPLEGDDALVNLVIGGVLSLLSFLIVPSILIAGYSVSVARNVLEGNPDPPAFDDWGQLAVDGLSVVAISILYSLPLVVASFVGVALLLTGVLAGGDGAGLAGLTIVLFAVGALFTLAYSLALGYVMPAAIVNYARTGKLSAAWDVAALRELVGDGSYAKGWAIGFAILLGVNSAAGSLLVFLVGFALLFYGQVAAMYAYTRGSMDALGIDPEPLASGRATASAAGQPTATGSAAPSGSAGPSSAAGAEATDETNATGPGGASPGAGTTADDRDLEDLATVDPRTGDALRAGGFETVADLRAARRADLSDVEGVGVARADRIKAELDGD